MMAGTTTLSAEDGHRLSAYEAKPAGTPRGGLVIVQEIFGVNRHIRSVADGYAADGYDAIAPALFDRAERGVELSYEPGDREKGVALRKAIPTTQMLLDVAAAAAAVRGAGKVGIVGYCLGGSLAWLAATRQQGFAAAVGYYGGLIAAHVGEEPFCPVMLHFGEEDRGISMSDVAKIKAQTDPARVQVFTYPGAGHAFNRDDSEAAFHEASAQLARERTLAFVREHVG